MTEPGDIFISFTDRTHVVAKLASGDILVETLESLLLVRRAFGQECESGSSLERRNTHQARIDAATLSRR
jgi:hypothetical protein